MCLPPNPTMLLYSSSDRFLIGAIVIHVSEHFREICDKRQHDLAQQQVSVSVHPPYMLVQQLGSIPPEGHWDTSATSPPSLCHTTLCPVPGEILIPLQTLQLGGLITHYDTENIHS